MIGTPRFQAYAIETATGWKYQMVIAVIGHDGEPFYVQSKREDFGSKKAALDHCKVEIQSLMKHLAESDGRIDPEKFIDLHTNQTREWGGDN